MSRLGSRTTRATIAVLLFALAIGIWATRPLHESMHVGTDFTPTLLVPPQGAKEVQVEVESNSLLSSSPRPAAPLPPLPPQPPDPPPLAYPREPCVFVHSDARRAFAIDVFVIVVALGLLAYIRRRSRHSVDTGELQPELA